MSKAFVGDVGTVITLEVGLDLTSADTTNIRVKKVSPTHDIETVYWEGDVFDTTKIKYVTEEGDFDVPGVYKLQSLISFSGSDTKRLHGDIVELDVLPLA
jgi:hypothetical protein